MEKQKWINNGGVYFPIPGYSTIYSSPGTGVFQIVVDPDTRRLGLGKISDTFEFNFKIYDLGCEDIFHRVITTWFSDSFIRAGKNLGVIFNGLKGTGKTIAAKAAFVEELRQRGFEDAKVVSAPADIVAEKDGKTWYFEIKKTTHDDKYFGAATLTEWVQAVKDPEHFRFVVAISKDGDRTFDFIEYTPEEFMEFSTVPPFKFYFNIDFSGKKKAKRGGNALNVTKELVERLRDVYYGMKGDS